MAGTRPHQAYRRLYKTRRWQRLRQQVLERQGWRCNHCGLYGPLDVHHKRPARQDLGRFWDPDNLEAICRQCHWQADPHSTTAARAAELREWDEYLAELEKQPAHATQERGHIND